MDIFNFLPLYIKVGKCHTHRQHKFNPSPKHEAYLPHTIKRRHGRGGRRAVKHKSIALPLPWTKAASRCFFFYLKNSNAVGLNIETGSIPDQAWHKAQACKSPPDPLLNTRSMFCHPISFIRHYSDKTAANVTPQMVIDCIPPRAIACRFI